MVSSGSGTGHARRIVLTFGVLVALLMSAMPAGITAAAQSSAMSVEDLVEKVGPAVVTVINMTQAADANGNVTLQASSSGTGFIIDKDGHIVTNWHVVYGGEAFIAILSDGTQVEAGLVGSDPRDDLAMVKIDPAKVPATVSFGDSDSLKPGAPVVAIGSPLGAFTNTVTDGIVSGLGRNEFAESGGSYQCQNYTNLIQHTAPINHGNSGGPLFNMKGEVIGVNTLGLPTYNGEPVQGLFFAVPSNLVKDVATQLIDTGKIAAPFIGASMVPITPDLNAQYQIGVDSGMLVYDISRNSAADDAGLEEGDVILAVDNFDITQTTSLSQILLNYKPGDTVTLTILRPDKNDAWQKGTVKLTFGETPQALFERCALSDG
ncbi:MAG: trypsin-like peptidase domain-containing protein [Thermomicrobiales bacterium]